MSVLDFCSCILMKWTMRYMWVLAGLEALISSREDS